MFNLIKVAVILAVAEVKKTSFLTNLLIISVMVLTFLNLIFGRGILTGLPQGSTDSYKSIYTGDILISNTDNQNYIKNPDRIINILSQNSNVKDFSVRYVSNMFVTSNYKLRPSDQTNIFIEVVYADLQKENKLFNFDNLVIDGSLENYKSVVGSSILQEYSTRSGIGDATLKNVKQGDNIQITNNGINVKVPISAVIKAKVTQVERRIYVSKTDYEKLVGKNYKDSVKEIAVILKPGTNVELFKGSLVSKGLDSDANIKTYIEAQPSFLNDIKDTFSILGDVIGSVGLIISCITIFIIIYVNAVNKRREIGILKGIGINTFSIILSFVLQAVTYSLIGSLLGIFILYTFIVPYFYQNPLDFPFADGILLAPYNEVFIRFLVLLIASAISGFFPAFLITKQKTINAILGR